MKLKITELLKAKKEKMILGHKIYKIERNLKLALKDGQKRLSEKRGNKK